MSQLREVYKCEACGNIVEIVHASKGELQCCDQPMKQLKENSVDAALEKHVPVLSLNGTTAKVNVGSVAHPMDPDHYIEFIELLTAARIYRAELSPGKAPEASFDVHGEVIGARAYCNKHGLWKNQ
jgi:superoxide reductase